MSEISRLLFEARRHLERGDSESAIAALTRAADLETAPGLAMAQLLQVLVGKGRYKEARERIEADCNRPDLCADACDALAFHAFRVGRHELSNGLYQRAAALAPEDPQLWYNLASSERSLGRLQSAAAAAERALQLDPQHYASLLLRSDVRRASSEANNVAQLSQLLGDEGSQQGRVVAGYALGKELHDLGRYDEAFAAYAAAASLRRANLNYDVNNDEAKLARIAEVFNASAVKSRSPAWAGERHIFIVGLPRSGTTLLERILSALPGVRSNGETDNFSEALARCAPATGGDVFQRFAAAPAACVSSTYEALASAEHEGGHRIEKLPHNYLYIGAIASSLPGAKIVVLRRSPLDSCFAMYRTLFGIAYPFSYSFDDLARYFAAYQGLMRHWKAILGDRIVEVEYEGLVSDPTTVMTRVVEACGLTWRDEALDLSMHSAASFTASASQVRGDIYRSSSGLWRKYERHLAPLRARLEALGVDLSSGEPSGPRIPAPTD